MQYFVQRFGDFVGPRRQSFLRRRQIANDFPLTLAGNLATTQKGRQNFLMSQVLAPRLELFRRLADLLAELDKGISEAMGIEIWQAVTDRADLACGSWETSG